MGIFFSGYGQTDRHGFGILTWKHVGTRKISTQSLTVDRYYALYIILSLIKDGAMYTRSKSTTRVVHTHTHTDSIN